jgi:hypothetical protein
VQDLTPQLRTRLGRVERAVGLFVLLATLLLVSGFCYYVYHTAKRKGWFIPKATYWTGVETADGLTVGDPVKLMGFDVGEIVQITGFPPDATEFGNVYLRFEIKAPFYGYIWSQGSRARVTSADFLGKRYLEATKGTNGVATYLDCGFLELPIQSLKSLKDLDRQKLADTIRVPNSSEVLARPEEPLTVEILQKIEAAGIKTLRLVDWGAPQKRIIAIWDPASECYTNCTRSSRYYLAPLESPALTDQLGRLIGDITNALPGVWSLTNQLAQLMTNAISLTARAEATLAEAQPAVTNLAVITGHLRDPNGSLGQWLLPADLHAELLATLTNANGTLTNASATLAAANTNLGAVVAQLNQPLQSLATVISNLNTQVQANTNFVGQLSALVVHLDDLIQGFKRHWLLRSAFKQKPTNAPPPKPRAPGKRPAR